MLLDTHRWFTVALTLALVEAACAEVETDLGDTPTPRSGDGSAVTLPGDPGGGVWVNNGLDDPDVSGIDPAFGLASAEGLAEDHGLLLDPSRHDTVQYLVECALAQAQAITKQVGGQELTFYGAMGLAPEWEDDACDEDCQQWVSACLLARTNISGQSVTVWMRAAHPAIGEGTSLLYPSYEASFFGNLFADPESQHLCRGVVVGPLLSQLHGRTCAALLQPSCGFIEYTQCQGQHRCELAPSSLLGQAIAGSPSDCIAGSLGEGDSLHTISTYVGLL